MGEGTNIEWATHTLNPWRGCEKVSPACKNCYAEALAKRNPAVLGEWGPGTKRVIASEKYWRLPLKWNEDAQRAKIRPRVFCASLSDVFEDREDLLPHRKRLFDLILKTPNLDWLVLTKRPENIRRILQGTFNGAASIWQMLPLSNLWLGTTVENQEMADKRIPHLLECPAPVRFLSCEPLLGPIDLGRYLHLPPCPHHPGNRDVWANRMPCDMECQKLRNKIGSIDWVIVGGESGPGSRPMKLEWARSIRDDCVDAMVAFHFKQWGAFDSEGQRVGKKKSGRLLDGKEWNQLPAPNLQRKPLLD